MMNPLKIHQLFTLSIIVKLIGAGAEFVLGIVLYIFPAESLQQKLQWLLNIELAEDPNDFLDHYLWI